MDKPTKWDWFWVIVTLLIGTAAIYTVVWWGMTH